MRAKGLKYLRTTSILLALSGGPALTPEITSAQAAGDRPATFAQITHVVLPSPDARAVHPPEANSDDVAPQSSNLVSAGLTITATFDTTITSDPNAAAIESTINTAIAIVQSQFSDPIIVSIKFTTGGGLGASSSWYATLPYGTFLGALKGGAKTGDDATATSLLPSVATNPVNGQPTINVKSANLRAIGIATGPTPDGFDGTISVNTAITSPGSPGSSGTFSLLPVVLHEIDEVLGLGSSLPLVLQGTIFPEDLYRYSAVNTRTFTATDSRTSGVFAYFSIDAKTALAEFDNQNDGGDFGDWQSHPLRVGVSPKVQDAFATAGASPAMSVELSALDVIGYDRVTAAPPPPPPAGPRTPTVTTVRDYDGDGRADIAVFRNSSGDWLVNRSSGGQLQISWGAPSLQDQPVPADYDGDGKADVAVYRKTTGQWFIRQSSNGALVQVSWGAPSLDDLPVPGDYDGDGKADIAIYRASTGQWFIQRSSTGTLLQLTWGASSLGDIPVPADYDGDHKVDIAVYRGTTGEWFILRSSDGSLLHTTWGAPSFSDIPIPADYDGDGKADIAVFRGTSGDWFVLRSSDGSLQQVTWGAPSLGDTPVPGDYDLDGKADVAVYRSSTGGWFIRRSSDGGLTNVGWGSPALLDVVR
jgi:hypothetical protein